MKKTILILALAFGFLAAKSQLTYTSTRNATNPEWIDVHFSNDGRTYYDAIVKNANTEKMEVEVINPPTNYDARSTTSCYFGQLAACMASVVCNGQLASVGVLGNFEIWTACFFGILH